MLQWKIEFWPAKAVQMELGMAVKDGWNPAFAPAVVGADNDGNAVLMFTFNRVDPNYKTPEQTEKEIKAGGMAMRG